MRAKSGCDPTVVSKGGGGLQTDRQTDRLYYTVICINVNLINSKETGSTIGNKIQYNTIKYNTVQYNKLYFTSDTDNCVNICSFELFTSALPIKSRNI